LSDPKKKQAFDNGASADDINSGHAGGDPFGGMGGMGGGFGGMDPNDLIKMMFMGGGMPGQGRGGGRGRGGSRGGGQGMGGMGGFDINDFAGQAGMGRGGGFNF